MLHDIAVNKYRLKKTNGTTIDRNPALGGGEMGGRKERESENKWSIRAKQALSLEYSPR